MLKPINRLNELRSSMLPSSTCCCHQTTPGQKIARKYRNAHKRRLQRREYRNLQKIVPSVSTKDKVSKVTVIEEAIRYIDELHQALAKRLQASQGLPMPISIDCVEQLAQQSFLAKKRASGPSHKPQSAKPALPMPSLQRAFPLHLLTSSSGPSLSLPVPASPPSHHAHQDNLPLR